MGDGSAADCLVCRKHQEQGPLVPGGPVAEDELVLVSHIAPADTLGGQGATAYLGQLLVEPRRHAPGLADLTDVEARAVGLWCARASRALRDVAGAEHVYAAVFGDGVRTCMFIFWRGSRDFPWLAVSEVRWDTGGHGCAARRVPRARAGAIWGMIPCCDRAAAGRSA